MPANAGEILHAGRLSRRKPRSPVAPLTSRLASVLRFALLLPVCGVLFVMSGWLATRIAVGGPADRVPNVVGLSAEEASAKLAAVGMQADLDDDLIELADIPANHVARQDPGPGTPVKRVRNVRLMLSTGPRALTLQSMVGEIRSRAEIALQQQGFEVDYVALAPSLEVPRGTVIGQEPDPAELAPGDVVPLRLLASLGPVPRYYVMANLVSLAVREVRPHLEARGFRVSEEPNRREVANVAPGTIVSQLPFPGFRIAAGGQITLRVSR